MAATRKVRKKLKALAAKVAAAATRKAKLKIKMVKALAAKTKTAKVLAVRTKKVKVLAVKTRTLKVLAAKALAAVLYKNHVTASSTTKPAHCAGFFCPIFKEKGGAKTGIRC